jgi:hypothetical protein
VTESFQAAKLVQAAMLVRRQRLWHVRYSPAFNDRIAAALRDLVVYGQAFVPEPDPDDVHIEPYRPRLP